MASYVQFIGLGTRIILRQAIFQTNEDPNDCGQRELLVFRQRGQNAKL